MATVKGRSVFLFLLFLLPALGVGWFLLGGGKSLLPGPGRAGLKGSLSGKPSPPPGEKPESPASAPKKAPGGKGLRKAVRPSPAGEEGKILLSGRVTGPDGRGIPGAAVLLDHGRRAAPGFLHIGGKVSARTGTDPKGDWEIPFSPGRDYRGPDYTVTAFKEGFVPGAVSFILGPGMKRLRVEEIRLRRGTVVFGKVLDWKGRPVKGARIGAEGPGSFFCGPAVTDGEGRYRFPGIPPGKTRLCAGAEGLASESKVVRIGPPGAPVEVDFRLTLGLSISGRVQDSLGRPIPGAKVSLEMAWRGEWLPPEAGFSKDNPAFTDEEGRFRIRFLDKSGLFRLTASAKGYLKKFLGKVAPGTENLAVTLSRGGGVRGKVLDFRGRPVPSFTVVGVRQPSWARWSVRGKKDGSFKGWGAPPGVWAFRAEVEGGLHSPPVGAEITGDVMTDLGTLVLPRPCALEVRVLDEKGVPLAGVKVRLQRNKDAEIPPLSFDSPRELPVPEPGSREMALFFPGKEEGPGGRTGEDGTCLFDKLTPGRWWAEAESDGGSRGEAGPVPLGPGEKGKARIVLRRGGKLLVLVRDAEGKPRMGADLEVTRLGPGKAPGSASFTLRTDAKGRAFKEGLFPGEYQVVLQRRIDVPSSPGGGVRILGFFEREGKPRRVVIREGKTALVKFTVGKKWKIRGLVQGRGGPAKGVEVHLIQWPGPSLEAKGRRTGGDGAYEFAGVDSGKYMLIWGRPGRPALSGEVLELGPEGGLLRKDLLLPGGRILGKVVDARGRPLSGLLVRIGRAGPARSEYTALGIIGGGPGDRPFVLGLDQPEIRTDKEGRFVLEAVPPGEWTVYVKKKAGKLLASVKVDVPEEGSADAGTLRVGGK